MLAKIDKSCQILKLVEPTFHISWSYFIESPSLPLTKLWTLELWLINSYQEIHNFYYKTWYISPDCFIKFVWIIITRYFPDLMVTLPWSLLWRKRRIMITTQSSLRRIFPQRGNKPRGQHQDPKRSSPRCRGSPSGPSRLGQPTRSWREPGSSWRRLWSKTRWANIEGRNNWYILFRFSSYLASTVVWEGL